MKYRISIIIAFLLALCFAGRISAQRVTQISPGKIVFYGVCMVDSNHMMAVGDSATILFTIAKDTVPAQLVNGKPNPYFVLDSRPSKAPCDSTHTFYAVSYYDTLHAVITSDAGLMFRTSDAGLSWIQSATGMTGQTFRAITHTADGGMIAVGDSGVILRSADSGVTWKWVPSPKTWNINGISINAAGHGYFVGEHGLIGRTTDFGLTWPNVTDTNEFGYLASGPVTLRSVAICTNDSAVAVGDSGAVGLTPDGITWYAMSGFPQSNTGDQYSPAYVAQSSFLTVVYTRELASPGGWLMLGDNDIYGVIEDTILNIHPHTPHTSPELFFVTANRSGNADGKIDNLVFRFNCAAVCGYTGKFEQMGGPFEYLWEVRPLTDTNGTIATQTGYFENFLFVSIDSLGFGYASCTGSDFLRTTDNGYTWTASLLYSNPFGKGNYDGLAIHTIDSNNAFAVGYGCALYRTTNGGMTWDSTGIGNGVNNLHGIAHPADNVYVVCGDVGFILRSSDNGVTWTNTTIDNQEIPSQYLRDIAFSTPDTGVAVGDMGTIIFTTDQGVTWVNQNNPFYNSTTNYGQVAAFPSGICYAATDQNDGLYTSLDYGQHWEIVKNSVNTISMCFYTDSIGVVATRAWSSALVNDTMELAFTKDGFNTPPDTFRIPIINNDRMVFHFLDSTSFLCFGSSGFVVKVDMSQGGASVTDLSSPQTLPIQLFPNPSATHSTTIEYDLDNSGPITIELWNILGEKVQSLFSGNEIIGHHSQQLKINPALHGSFFVKVISGTETETLPISVE